MTAQSIIIKVIRVDISGLCIRSGYEPMLTQISLDSSSIWINYMLTPVCQTKVQDSSSLTKSLNSKFKTQFEFIGY